MWDFVLAYIDDVNIYSSSFEKHLSHMDIVLSKLRQANLKLNPDKCYFEQDQIEFLGHKISGKGITPTTAKVAAVSNFPRPKNLRALRGFLDLARFYHRFINDFLNDVEFVLYTDTLHFALDAVLSQPGDNGLEGVVKYAKVSPISPQIPIYNSDQLYSFDLPQQYG
ncbi:5009_t:CDS:2 [Cetraspora pellucida]|uniref:5009_t:CDS:1 n=1 Tax=Cetraspora pellucida TaxID=1433469 RepID=A0A9N9HG64_9GLOM|nr:5009_t:CDS:2 [Cetraspora pellucida]